MRQAAHDHGAEQQQEDQVEIEQAQDQLDIGADVSEPDSTT